MTSETFLSITKSVLASILEGLYEPFWFALLMAVLFMFFYLYAYHPDGRRMGKGWKDAILNWALCFKNEVFFRRLFFLAFYSAMILFRTLLNRNLWMNPLSDVFGSWWIYDAAGELTTECFENLILMLPFTVLLLWAVNAHKDAAHIKMDAKGILWLSVKASFLFSVAIEFLQLFLRVGTFQLSDIFYNTLGGLLGGIIYWIGWKYGRRVKMAEKDQ